MKLTPEVGIKKNVAIKNASYRKAIFDRTCESESERILAKNSSLNVDEINTRIFQPQK